MSRGSKDRRATVAEAERGVLAACRALREQDVWWLVQQESMGDLAEALFALMGADERKGTR